MIKRDELTNPQSCMSRAREDEMTFVLLGRDKAAPVAIRAWVAERLRLGKNTQHDAQIIEALLCAEAMDGRRPDEAASARAEQPVKMEDLCPFHDLGREFSDCTCPPDHPNRKKPAEQGGALPVTPYVSLEAVKDLVCKHADHQEFEHPGSGRYGCIDEIMQALDHLDKARTRSPRLTRTQVEAAIERGYLAYGSEGLKQKHVADAIMKLIEENQ